MLPKLKAFKSATDSQLAEAYKAMVRLHSKRKAGAVANLSQLKTGAPSRAQLKMRQS